MIRCVKLRGYYMLMRRYKMIKRYVMMRRYKMMKRCVMMKRLYDDEGVYIITGNRGRSSSNSAAISQSSLSSLLRG